MHSGFHDQRSKFNVRRHRYFFNRFEWQRELFKPFMKKSYLGRVDYPGYEGRLIPVWELRENPNETPGDRGVRALERQYNSSGDRRHGCYYSRHGCTEE